MHSAVKATIGQRDGEIQGSASCPNNEKYFLATVGCGLCDPRDADLHSGQAKAIRSLPAKGSIVDIHGSKHELSNRVSRGCMAYPLEKGTCPCKCSRN